MKTPETLARPTEAAQAQELLAIRILAESARLPWMLEDTRAPALEKQKREVESRIGEIDYCHLDFLTQADNVTPNGTVIDKARGNFILEKAVVAGAVLEGRYDDRWYGHYVEYEDVRASLEHASRILAAQKEEWQWLYCTADGRERFRVLSFLDPAEYRHQES